jgi:hypothetical protein
MPDDPDAQSAPTVIRISPMAHLVSLLAAVGLLVFIPVFGIWALALLVVPAGLSAAVVRLRTVADRDTVTARGLFGHRRLGWGDIEGLRFDRGGWARACCADGTRATLPAVTFATLPRLTAASGGKVPNPYRR